MKLLGPSVLTIIRLLECLDLYSGRTTRIPRSCLSRIYLQPCLQPRLQPLDFPGMRLEMQVSLMGLHSSKSQHALFLCLRHFSACPQWNFIFCRLPRLWRIFLCRTPDFPSCLPRKWIPSLHGRNYRCQICIISGIVEKVPLTNLGFFSSLTCRNLMLGNIDLCK